MIKMQNFDNELESNSLSFDIFDEEGKSTAFKYICTFKVSKLDKVWMMLKIMSV